MSRVALFMIAGMVLFSTHALGDEHPELRAFPPAEAGMERFIITLSEKDRQEEANFKVELIPGKVMLTDGANQLRHASKIEERPLTGWGYTYYQVTGEDVAMSTMMAAPEGSKMIKQFVQGMSTFIRYNSRLPIVIYAPKSYEIRYRIWSAKETAEKAYRDDKE